MSLSSIFTGPINLPASLQLTKIGQLKNIAVPTVQIDIDPKCEYHGVITIHKFEPTFKLAGGINLPKIISCQGSDGISRRQLVKVSIAELFLIQRILCSQNSYNLNVATITTKFQTCSINIL